MMEAVSNWLWLEPTVASTTRLTAQLLSAWCKTIVVPEVRVSETASHFKYDMMVVLEKSFGVDRWF